MERRKGLPVGCLVSRCFKQGVLFKNDTLASQFLRNYTNIPLFANVRPEDIRDVSSKYRAFLGVEWVICLKTWKKWTSRLKDEIHKEKTNHD